MVNKFFINLILLICIIIVIMGALELLTMASTIANIGGAGAIIILLWIISNYIKDVWFKK